MPRKSSLALAIKDGKLHRSLLTEDSGDDQEFFGENSTKVGSNKSKKWNQTLLTDDEGDHSDENAKYSEAELTMLVNSCVRWVLMQEHLKTSLSVFSITQFIRENHQLDRADLTMIVKKVKDVLFDAFGLKLVESKDSTSVTYMLSSIFTKSVLFPEHNDKLKVCMPDLNGISKEDESEMSDDELGFLPEDVCASEFFEECKTSMAFIILTLIFINEEPISESDLFQNLNDMGFRLDEYVKTIDNFAPIILKKVITEDLCRRHYLKRTRLPAKNPDEATQYTYDWGERARLEFPVSGILEFSKELYPEGTDVTWSRFEARAKHEDQRRDCWIFGEDYNKVENGNDVSEDLATVDCNLTQLGASSFKNIEKLEISINKNIEDENNMKKKFSTPKPRRVQKNYGSSKAGSSASVDGKNRCETVNVSVSDDLFTPDKVVAANRPDHAQHAKKNTNVFQGGVSQGNTSSNPSPLLRNRSATYGRSRIQPPSGIERPIRGRRQRSCNMVPLEVPIDL